MDTLLDNIVVKKFTDTVSRQDLLTEMGNGTVESGWAKPGFVQALLTREEKYPTGLHTLGVEVAIPHADPEWTITPAMVVGISTHPVAFEPMGGEGDKVQARFIFMLLIPDAETHMQFLQTLAEFIEDEAKLSQMGKTNDVTPLIDFFRSRMAV